jgi:hypothetical protein
VQAMQIYFLHFIFCREWRYALEKIPAFAFHRGKLLYRRKR